MCTTPNIIRPDSPDDPRLRHYQAVRDRDLLGTRSRAGLFIGETPLILRAMLNQPGLTHSVLLADNRLDEFMPILPADVPVYVVPLAWMERITGFPIHRGVLAIGHRPDLAARTLNDILPRSHGPLTILICVGQNNIDNIGQLFRNAACFGVDAVLLDPTCHDPLYRKSIRVSIGHVLTMPWARSTDWPGDLDRLRDEWNVTLIAAATGANSQPLDEIEPPQRVAVIVGPEYEGLPDAILEKCHHRARIPMAAGCDSLNVAVAGAVCLHRFSRGIRR